MASQAGERYKAYEETRRKGRARVVVKAGDKLPVKGLDIKKILCSAGDLITIGVADQEPALRLRSAEK